jgi:hypothetical protein
MMIVVAPIAVALVAFIIYTLDRKSKGEPIVWESAGKLSVFGGLVTAGVVFAMTSEGLADVAKVATESAVHTAQEMFVGKPTF